jgi:hypothetical protein
MTKIVLLVVGLIVVFLNVKLLFSIMFN